MSLAALASFAAAWAIRFSAATEAERTSLRLRRSEATILRTLPAIADRAVAICAARRTANFNHSGQGCDNASLSSGLSSPVITWGR